MIDISAVKETQGDGLEKGGKEKAVQFGNESFSVAHGLKLWKKDKIEKDRLAASASVFETEKEEQLKEKVAEQVQKKNGTYKKSYNKG